MTPVDIPALQTPREAADWLSALGCGALRTDHRRLKPGDSFLAWPGRVHDARQHLDAAWAAGAVACLLEREGWAPPAGARPAPGRMATLAGLRRQAGEVASLYFGVPTAAMDVVAVTGTNGKTSTTWWIAQALRQAGRRCAVAGTLGWGEPPQLETTGLTTPDAVALQAAFAEMARCGLTACAIEASSIGLAEHRLRGTRIAVAAFTNLTRDHLDYHGTMDAYGAAKRSLFDAADLRAAVIHVGDAFGATIAADLAAAHRAGAAVPALWTVARDDEAPSAGGVWAGSPACAEPVRARAEPPGSSHGLRPGHLCARRVRQGRSGLAFDLCEGEAVQSVDTHLVGDFQVENLLVVAGCLRALGMDLPAAAAALRGLTPVPGRMQRVAPPAGVAADRVPEVVVDYAHTPDALEKVLAALAPRAAARGGALWCVFGCGGDRDATKRAPMGAAAVQGADRVVVTSDNPRSESPEAIVEQILAGARASASPRAASPALAIVDRRAAIAHALHEAAPEDLVLIAGKGHETTQEIAGRREPFDDVAEAATALHGRAAAGGHA